MDAKGFYSNDKTTIISGNDLYLLGLLNSKVTDFFIHAVSSTKQDGYYEYKPMYLAQIPIRTIDFAIPEEKARHNRIVALVERMLRLHKEPPEPAPPEENENRLRKIAATDAEIDALVCELYGLTAEEIRILEESGRTTDK